MNGLRSVFKLRKLLRCDIKCRKNLDFGGCVLYLCYREVRLHLSIAFESQLSLLCIRLALTLLSRSQAAPQHSFLEPALIALHSVGTDIASRSQAAPQFDG